MGADLSAEIQESKDIMAEFIKVFTIQYSKMYLVALMKIAKKNLAKEAAGAHWVLLKCEKSPAPQALKTGTVKKLSKYLKNWNSRYVVVKGDYLIEYFESEEKSHAPNAKPLGIINMSNKNLHRDANDTVLNRIIALAEKCGMNVDEMPKPDKYPDFTLEIFHERKGPIYLECENEAEWKAWCDIIDRCRWQAPRYNLYTDKAHLFAFPKALWRTRWECSMWGWWWGGGGEEAQLVDAINDKIADVVLHKLDRKLTMPWAARSKIRNKFIQTVDGLVNSAVAPAWKAAYSAVEKVRPEVEPKIKEGMKPIVDAQKTIQDEICKLVEENGKSFIEEKILPHLSPLLDVVFSPVVDGFKLIIRAFDVALEKGREKYTSREDRLYMVWHHNYNSEYWDAERKMWDLYEPLWALRLVFEDVYPWTITGRARRRLRKSFDNALFTFETLLEEGKESGRTWEQAADEARGLLARDCRTAISRVLGQILFGVVENFFEKLVVRPARALVKPLSDKIPEAIKDFVDPDDLLEELLYNILRRTCAMVFEPYTNRIDLGVAIPQDGPIVTRSAAVDVPPPQSNGAPAAATQNDDEAARKKKEDDDAAAAKAAADKAAEDERIAEEARKAADAAATAAAEAEAAAAEAEAAARKAAEDAAARKAEEDAAKQAEDAEKAEEARKAAVAAAAAEEAAKLEAAALEAEAAAAEAEAAAAEAEALKAEADARKAEEEAAAAAEVARKDAEEREAAAEAARIAAEAEAAQKAEEEAAALGAAQEAERIQSLAATEAVMEACEVEAVAVATAEAIGTTITSTEDATDGIEVVYFDGKGRAQATRIVLAIAGIPFRDTRLSGEAYGALIGTGALPLDTLPILKVEGKVISSQSQAMLRFAAELAELQLSTPEDVLLGEDILGTAEDLAQLASTWYQASEEDKPRLVKEIADSGFAFFAKRIENLLDTRTHNEPFITVSISFVDVYVYCVATGLRDLVSMIGAEDPIPQFPKLQALVAAIETIPAALQYL